MIPNLLNLDICLGFRFMMFYRQITQHPTEIGVTRPSPRLANGDRSLRGSAKSAASPAIVTWRSSGTCRMGPVMFNRRAPCQMRASKLLPMVKVCLGHLLILFVPTLWNCSWSHRNDLRFSPLAVGSRQLSTESHSAWHVKKLFVEGKNNRKPL